MNMKCYNCNSKKLKLVNDEGNGFLKRIFYWLMLKFTNNSKYDLIKYKCEDCNSIYSSLELQEINNFPSGFYKNKYLMTVVEKEFFDILKSIVPDKYVVYPQVPMNILVKSKRVADRNRINRKRVDFVIFSKDNYNPQVVIELDDKTHNLPSRIKRDRVVDMALFKANLPIVHFPVKQRTNRELLGKELQDIISTWKYKN